MSERQKLIDEARSQDPGLDPQDLIRRLADALEAEENLMAEYSRALDEIYELRTGAAHESEVLKAHLGFKTFPKSRRAVAAEQIYRMHAAARGHAAVVYNGSVLYGSLAASRKAAGMDQCLTRSSWEAEHANGNRRAF